MGHSIQRKAAADESPRTSLGKAAAKTIVKKGPRPAIYRPTMLAELEIPQSSDINCIENLCYILDSNLRNSKMHTSKKEQLSQNLAENSKALGKNTMKNLIRLMHLRYEADIEGKGYWAKYLINVSHKPLHNTFFY